MDILETFNKSLNYIEDNLLSPSLSVDKVAESVYVSSFYFQRMFAIFAGIGVGEYIRNRRLSECAEELLLDSEMRIIDLAFKYGYDTPESFSRAFKKFHGVSPKEMKTNKKVISLYPRLEIVISVKGGKTMKYEIEELGSFKIVVLVKKFDSDKVLKDIPLFWDEFMKKGYQKDVPPMLGVCFPLKENEKATIYGIGSVEECVSNIPEGFEVVNIPAATWAKFYTKGAMPETIQKLWKKVYTEWLPNSKYELVPGYDFECYSEGDTSKDDYECGVWIPVKLRQ